MDKIKGKSLFTPGSHKNGWRMESGTNSQKTHNGIPLFDKLFCGFDLLALVTGYLVK